MSSSTARRALTSVSPATKRSVSAASSCDAQLGGLLGEHLRQLVALVFDLVLGGPLSRLDPAQHGADQPTLDQQRSNGDDERDEHQQGARRACRAGSVWAAAIVTTPRMPAHTMTVPSRQPSGWSSMCEMSASSLVSRVRICSRDARRKRNDRRRRNHEMPCLGGCGNAAVVVTASTRSWNAAMRGWIFSARSARLWIPHTSGPTNAARTSSVARIATAAIQNALLTPSCVVAHLLDDANQLEPHDEVDAALEHQLGGPPRGAIRDALLRGERPRGTGSRHEPRDNRRDQARRVERFRWYDRDKGHGEGDHGAHHRIRDAPAHREVEATNAPPDERGDRERIDERERHSKDGDGHCRGGDGGAQQHQRDGVVEHRLALEHGDNAGVDAQLADHAGRDRVGWADDGTERERPRQRQPGNEPVKEQPEDRGADHDERYRQPRDGANLAAEVGRRHVHGGRVQQRRQDAREDQLRLDGDVRDARE